MPSRAVGFAVVVAGCVLLALGFVAYAAVRPAGGEQGPARADSVRLSRPAGSAPVAGVHRLLVRRSEPGDARMVPRVSRVVLADGTAELEPTDLRCRRIHFHAGNGLCLVENRSGLGYSALVLGARLEVLHRLALTGVPSRARVSPSGRWGATTTFTTGDSYAQAGQFSTRSNIIDMASGRIVADLETFRLMRGADRFDAPDVNLWGITFAKDDDTFFATLRTGDTSYLMKGSIAGRAASTVRENVECPSLSPDETRIAYKKRVGGDGAWRLHVLDLSTMHETPVSEQRSIDDQVEWLDDRHLLYGDGGQVWMAEANGSGRPRQLLSGQESPAVID